MKRHDIEKQLKQEAQEHTPEIYDKILFSARSEGLLPDGTANAEIRNGGNTAVLARNKKRVITGVAALLVAIVACLAVILPHVLRGGGGIPLNPTNIVLSANDVYGMGAVSTVKLLGGDTSVQAIKKLSAASRAAATGESGVKAQVQKFNEYFTALDSFMGEEIVTTVTENNTDPNYPYEKKLTINSIGFNGEAVQNVMYFTETLYNSGYGDDDDDDDETEAVYRLTGVLVVDGADYRLEGERTFEQEDDETENELKIRAYADVNDRRNYVQMEQEYSVENNETETEYVYSVYSNGALVEQTAVEFETEKKGAREETDYELEFRKGAARGRYVVERVTQNGKVHTKVKYNVDGQQGQFEVKSSSGHKYSYCFPDGTVLSF